MLLSSDFAVWLAGLPGMNSYFPNTPEIGDGARFVTCTANTLPITFDGYGMFDTPNQYLAVAVTGSGPTQAERTVDVPLVSVMFFGNQDDHASAEKMTQTVDDTLMGVVPPVQIPSGTGGPPTGLISLDYTGGAPRFLDRDDAHRSVFTCSYTLRIARTVF